ncbi:uncharacterized protein [Euwallacea similis]|uniref:uncharacterized protein isoform X1 n=2 Tax=Euwallacea similis TaxID=1736056 RepID=UPI00344D0146
MYCMRFPILLVTILVACAIETLGYTRTDRRVSSIDKRQAANADQMVQNILNWLQDVYVQNSRSVRQGTLREYLPPSNTEKPRPFRPGYPPAGYSPEPAFPLPTNPATGGITAPEGYRPDEQASDVLIPPEIGSGGGQNGYPKADTVKPSFTLPTTGGASPQATRPTTTIYPSTYPQEHTGYPTGQPTVPSTIAGESQPGTLPTRPETGPTVTSTLGIGYPDSTPGVPFTSQTAISTSIPEQTQPSYPPYTSPPQGTQTPVAPEGTTSTTQAEQATTTLNHETSAPSTTLSPSSQAPTEGAAPSTLPPSTTLAPNVPSAPAETTTGSTPAESEATTISPESNTIPGPARAVPGTVEADDSKHPPHIHAIDVQCSKESMTINLEFNRVFDGIIYSKGHYGTPECRYVQENSGQTKYTFTVSLDKCGTEFVNAFDTQNQSYLENVLVLQNEAGIQEVWDTVRSVRCLWEGNIKDTLSVAFSIGMLTQEIITFSGDTAMARLDVVLGRGPFGEPANGLVKIGEQMTLVVAVSGDPGFDLQVKDCRAVDSEGKNSVVLTDEEGCILKPKLFGAFQKTRETGSTGASIIAYAYFNAFKFPDEMDLMIECNIELCKTDCDICSKEGQQVEPARRRRKRDAEGFNSTVMGDWVTMGKLVRVILPEDLNHKTALEVSTKDHICMATQSFVFSTAVLVTLLVITSFTSLCLWMNMNKREKVYLKY